MLYILVAKKETSDDVLKEFIEFSKKCLGKEFCYEIKTLGECKLIFIIGESIYENKHIAECLYEFIEISKEKECDILKAKIGELDLKFLCNCIDNNQIGNLLLEAIINPSMNKKDIIEKFKDIIEGILEFKTAKKILITDPYFLSSEIEFVKDLFQKIKKLIPELNELLIIIPKKNYEEEEYNKLKEIFENLEIDLNIIIDNANEGRGMFHDRFWLFYSENLTEGVGLYVGTSLNGLGKKYSLIDYLDKDDYLDIACEIKKYFKSIK